MGSRIRKNPKKIFELFAEIARPVDGSIEPFILQKYPADYADEEVLKNVCRFAYPWETNTERSTVEHFTFVLTDIDSNFRFGFCRHATSAQTCLCIISYLPWYEIFYKLLNHLADILNKSDSSQLELLLFAIYQQPVPSACQNVDSATPNGTEKFSFTTPNSDVLPSIPESRNLTEYYNAVDTSTMMVLFASMLHERRILVTSKKLSRLTACIHGADALLYPMCWQHLYIPVLPPHLIDYCSAPMPFLIGVHSTVWNKVKKEELGDVVILDADTGVLTSEYDDLAALPADVVSSLKKRLKVQQSDKMSSSLMSDGLSRAFLKAIVHLIGGYRDGLRFRPEERITFDADAFVQSRPHSSQPFLRQMLQLQLFEQFVLGRLEMLNAGHGFVDLFETETNALAADKWGTESRYHDWLNHMKKQSKKGKEKWVEFTSRANPAVKHAVETVRNKGKKAYKDLKLKMDELKKDEDSPSPETVRTDEPLARPPRPPAPDFSRASQRHSITRKSVYDKTRQYKVIYNADSTANDTRVSRRTSSRDDTDVINYSRVSLDLMDDPDIQDIVMKSYSLEDISHLSSDDDDEEEENNEDDTKMGKSTSMVVKPRLSRTGHTLPQSNSFPNMMGNGRDVASTTIISEDLIHVRNNKQSTDASFPEQNLMRPLKASRTLPRDTRLNDAAAASKEVKNPIPLPRRNRQACNTLPAGSSLDANEERPPVPKPRRTLSRNAAFYRDRPQPASVTRKSSTQQAAGMNNAHTTLHNSPKQEISGVGNTQKTSIQETSGVYNARKVFLQQDSQRLADGLDQFDPLRSGQLALDTGPPGSTSPEENLLKEWNLDFTGLQPPRMQLRPYFQNPAMPRASQPAMCVPSHASVRSQVMAFSQPPRVYRAAQPFIPRGTVAMLQRNYTPPTKPTERQDSQDPFDDLLNHTMTQPAPPVAPVRTAAPTASTRPGWTTFD